MLVMLLMRGCCFFGFVDKIFWICSNDYIITWVTRPERPKGAKEEVKEALRAPKLLVFFINGFDPPFKL